MAVLGQATVNPAVVKIPVGVKGRYRIRVLATSPGITGELSQPITIVGSDTSQNPVNPPQNPTTANVEGFVDYVACEQVAGWVWDASRPNDDLTVELLANGQVGATQRANQYRSDLEQAGKGNGVHGYTIMVPNAIKTGAAVAITVRVRGSSYQLVNQTGTLTCPAATPTTVPDSLPPVESTSALQLLAPGYDCQTGAFTFRSVGGNGNSISYMSVGTTGWTTTPGPFMIRPAGDAQPFPLMARQSDQVGNYRWNFQAVCQGDAARVVTSAETGPIMLELYPNPTTGPVTVTTNAPADLLQIVTPEGRVITHYQLDKTQTGQRTFHLDLSNLTAGVYFLEIQ